VRQPGAAKNLDSLGGYPQVSAALADGFTAWSVIAQDGQFAIGTFTNTQGVGADEDWVVRLLTRAIFDLQAGWA
jgi:hypothetical protein